MIPIYLDPAQVQVGLAGRGTLAVRRLAWLRARGAEPLVFSDAPEPDLAAAAGAELIARLPTAADLAGLGALWAADLDPTAGAALARLARGAGLLVNIEDVRDLCDFHTPAVVARGGLVLAAGTGGASPAVAKAARMRLEAAFSPAWGPALAEIAAARETLRARKAPFEALTADANARLAAHGLS